MLRGASSHGGCPATLGRATVSFVSYHRALAEVPPAQSISPAVGLAPFVLLAGLFVATVAMTGRRPRPNRRAWTHTTDLAEALYGLRRARAGLP